jgi:hypothetical protein
MLSNYNQQSNENFDSHSNYWRISRECRRVTRQAGFLGDSLSDRRQIGTLDQERTIASLCSQVEPRIRIKYKTQVRFFIRNIVLNSKDSTK